MGGGTSDADTALLPRLYSGNGRLMFTGAATINSALQRDKKRREAISFVGVDVCLSEDHGWQGSG